MSNRKAIGDLLRFASAIQKNTPDTRKLKSIALDKCLAAFKYRVFVRGLDVSLNRIANSYSTKPFKVTTPRRSAKGVWVRPSAYSQLKKPKKRKDRTHVVIPGGYKQFRAIQGLQTSTVSLWYTGSLRNSLRVVYQNNKAVLEIIGTEETKKARDLEKYYKKTIFELNRDEERIIDDNMVEGYENLLKRYNL